MGVYDWLRSAFGRSQVERAASGGKAVAGRVIGELPLYFQLQRIGGSVTPQQVSEILRQADVGYIWRLMDLANDARQKDCHLQGILEKREQALASLDWTIEPFVKRGRKQPKRRDAEIAAFCEDAIRGATGDGQDTCPFADMIAHEAGAVYYGHAVSETMNEKRGGYIVPRGWSRIAPRRFIYDLANGHLCWSDLSVGGTTKVDLRAQYPGKFIQHQPRVNGDVACREGLVRPLMWAALFRNWDIRDWLALAELAWKPWRTGQYQKGASDEDINNLVSVLENMTASGVATYPETTTVTIEWPKNATSGGTSTHKELADFFAAEMSKAVLGQTLTTDQGTKGARSLGEVHERVEDAKVANDARALEPTLRRDLLAPLVAMNFGPDEMVPDFRFIIKNPADIASFSTGIKNLKDAGLAMPAGWVRDRIGMPDPEPHEELVGWVDIPIDPETGLPREPSAEAADAEATDAPTSPDAADAGDTANQDDGAADGGDSADAPAEGD